MQPNPSLITPLSHRKEVMKTINVRIMSLLSINALKNLFRLQHTTVDLVVSLAEGRRAAALMLLCAVWERTPSLWPALPEVASMSPTLSPPPAPLLLCPASPSVCLRLIVFSVLVCVLQYILSACLPGSSCVSFFWFCVSVHVLFTHYFLYLFEFVIMWISSDVCVFVCICVWASTCVYIHQGMCVCVCVCDFVHL